MTTSTNADGMETASDPTERRPSTQTNAVERLLAWGFAPETIAHVLGCKAEAIQQVQAARRKPRRWDEPL